jgi:tRNA(Ile2) C34 agmatinyltransferase TiaS
MGAYAGDVGVQFRIKKGQAIIELSQTKISVMILTSIKTIWPENPEWQQRCEQLQGADSLTAMVWIALQMGLWMARMVLEQELNQRSAMATTWPACPDCGQRLRSKGYRARQMVTLVGEIH